MQNYSAETLPDRISDSPYFKAFKFSIINVFGSFISILAVAITIFFKTGSLPHLQVLIQNGEVIIISIALMISALYTLAENKKLKHPLINLLFWSSFVLVIICIIIYLNTVDKQILGKDYFKELPDDNKVYPILKLASIAIFFYTFAAVFLSQLFEYKSQSPPIYEERKDDLNNLSADFKRLKK